jgi:hypothetical protein
MQVPLRNQCEVAAFGEGLALVAVDVKRPYSRFFFPAATFVGSAAASRSAASLSAASLASRSLRSRAVFSRVATCEASYSAMALVASRACVCLRLKLASALACASGDLLLRAVSRWRA